MIFPIAALLSQTAVPAAVELRRMPAVEANQGVTADARSVYAVDNSTIARYDKRTGRREAAWRGDPARFKHVNSCIRSGPDLVCAASNYPDTPMRSQLLWIDARTMHLKRVRDLGAGYGSLTWADRHLGDWWLGWANYDGKGGEPGRDHRATVLVRYDAQFRERRRYAFPDTVLARFAPRSSSGGAWGRDGLLYVTGHDLPELYVLRVAGDRLVHIATIATPTGGQAIGWDPAATRTLWSIERKRAELVASKVPVVTH